MSNKGFLLVLMHSPVAFEDELNAWYDTEHVPERIAVSGFENGRRYICIDGHPKYLAMYDLADENVLETEEYRKISGQFISPWTRRVNSRVKVYRSLGQQIYPGNQVTVPTVRTTLLRFSGTPVELVEKVVGGMRANFEGRAETKQVRVLAYHVNGAVDFIGLVGSQAPDKHELDMSTFGEAAPYLDMVNTYAPY